ncbi:MAG: F0F1 ATP synthase subunit B [Phycisphaeraceae bacterium]|nr:F0F1 ATP synthase subunit B [Phycisphaeraceae bacterium]
MERLMRAVAMAGMTLMPAVVCAAEDDAHAAKGDPSVIHAPNAGVMSGIMAVVVFLLVYMILATKVWPKIAKGLKEREEKIRQEIAAAEAARQQAADALAMYQQSLAEARAEAQKMLDETRSQQQKLAAELKAKADTELGQMREKALRDIEGAKRAALNEVYADTANLAAMVASKILRREINAADHQAFVDESLAELESVRS